MPLDQLSLVGSDPWMEREVVVPKSGRPLELVYHLVQSEAALEHMRDVCVRTRDIAHDTETSGLVPALGGRVIGHSLAAQTAPAQISMWYAPIRHILTAEPQLPAELVSRVVGDVLCSSGRCFWAHGKFDWAHCWADGIQIARERHDVLVLANAADENEPSFKLKALADKYVIDGARVEERALEDWIRADARSLGLPYEKRRKIGLDDLEELGAPTYMERFGFSRTPIALCGRYACRDVFYNLYLGLVRYVETAREYGVLYAREMAVARELCRMEWGGLPVDEAEIRRATDLSRQEVEHWLGECRRLTGDREFSASEADVRELLYGKLGLPVPKWTGGGKSKTKKSSVDREARELLKHRHPVCEPILEAISKLADAQKFHSTYSANFLRYYDSRTGRIYPSYNQMGERDKGLPRTGRVAAQAPNTQNQPTAPLDVLEWTGAPQSIDTHRYFVVPDGFVRLYADFVQIELKTLAWFCQDPNLLRAFREGEDVHQGTADSIAIERRVAKQVNFLTVLGGTERALALRMPGYYEDPEGTREEAVRVLERFFEKHPAILAFRDYTAARMRRNGCLYVSPFGRPRRIPDIAAQESWRRERALRQLMSSIISGSAADIMKECMIRTAAWLRSVSPVSALRMTIHDELVFDLERNRWIELTLGIKDLMEDWPMITQAGPDGFGEGVPIRVTCAVTDKTWADKQELRFEGRRILNPEVIG